MTGLRPAVLWPVLRVGCLLVMLGSAGAALAQADRGRPFLGLADRLSPVAATEITNNSGMSLWLCHHVRQARLAWMPVSRRTAGYVLADNACDSDRFVALERDQMVAAQQAGLIPAEVPADPRLSVGQLIAGHWGWAVLTALAAVGLGLRRRRLLARRDRQRMARL